MSTDPQNKVRLLVLASTRLYREGLVQVLGSHRRIEIVGAGDAVDPSLHLIETTRPDAVLLDAVLGASADAVRSIIRASPSTRVVAFCSVESEEAVIACAEAGVAGYLPPEATIDDAVGVIESALRNELVCSPRLAATLLRRVRKLARERKPASAGASLTRREAQVLRLIDEGLSNKEIASRLQIGLATVKNHAHNAYEKLGVSSRAAAAARLRADADPDRSIRADSITA